MKLRTALAITRELRRMERLNTDLLLAPDADAIYGAKQALAWALSDDAMAPFRCFGGRPSSTPQKETT